MSVASSNEMFINMKNIPAYNRKLPYWEQEKSTLQFYKEEWNKINHGITIGGIKIHPWLYFHLNYFKTPIPQPDKTEKIMNPPLRDNEWYFMENYQAAEAADKVLMIFGTRRYSKSSIIASVLSWLATTKENGKSEVIGGSDPDLKQLTSLIKSGMIHMHPAFKLPSNTQDWNSHIKLGVKHKSNEEIPYSEIIIKNAVDGVGKASEKGAGGSPVGWVLDEALEENTPLFYENGEKPIKDCNIGDKIYDGDGKLTTIIEKHKFENTQLYRITFSDNREIECCGKHLWEVQDNNSKKTQILSTEELLMNYRSHQIDPRYNYKKRIKAKYNINLNKPIEYSQKEFYLDPYFLGLYIGDGFCNASTIGTDDDYIANYLINYAVKLGFKITITNIKTKSNNFKKINIVNSKGKLHPIREELKRLNTFKEKSIPEEYLYSSIEQRLELLRGLMDSDGYCNKNRLEFSSSYPKVQEGFEKLCRSLGIRLKINIKKAHYIKDNVKILCKDSKRYALYTNLDIFNLPRKKELQNISINKKAIFYINKINIVDIQPTQIANAYCIKVDNSSKLFIAGNYLVTHNCGKFSFIPFLQSALPAFKTVYGMKLTPILTGTSGNVELSKDAATVLSDPITYGIMPMDWDRLENKIPDITDITWKRSTFGIFVPAQMTGESGLIKIENNLSNYLKVEDKELKEIRIQTTDWTNAKKVLEEELNKVKKDADATNKRKMYYPTCTEDCFISNINSPFPSNDARLHRQKLIEEGNIGRNVEIFDKGSGVLGYEFSDKQRAQYPFKGGMCNAPVVFFDDPPSIKPSYGEFVGGLDGYKQALSGTDSVGTLFIIQRRFNLNIPIELIKCSYASRPSTMVAFNRTCELMIEGWGAETLIENVDTAFIEYLKSKNKAEMLLADGVEFSKLINPNSNPSNNLGIYPSVKNQAYLLSLAADYCNEEVVIGYEDDGTPITKLGIYFIPDIDLLEEIIDFKYDENHDRITAFALALGWARELDRRRIIPRDKDINTELRKKNIQEAKMMNKGFVSLKKKKDFTY